MVLPSQVSLKRRVMALFIAVALAELVLAGRLAWIQVVKGQELGLRALEVRTHEVPVEAKRGTIYDRRGRELAISISAESAFAVPAEVKDPSKTAAVLSGILGMPEDDLFRRLTTPAAFVWLRRKVEPEQAKKIRELKLPGVDLTQESKRFYPKGSLLSHVLGISGIDNQGLEGVELEYDHELRGIPGKIVVEYDARGRELPQALHRYEPAVDGNDLFLTVDEVIQHIAERELKSAVARYKAKGGVVVAMNPKDGAILALANQPDYDPNRYQDYPDSARRNAAISDTICPGSTFKPVTAAAALEEGVANLNSTFYCGGTLQVPGHVVHCWLDGGHGSQNFIEIVQNSCNVAFANLGLGLGAQRFYKYLDAFGITSRTGIDLPGEAVGLVPPVDSVKPVDIAVMSFGQTLTLTPIQLATAISAIVNGGVMVRPHVVKEIRGPDGTLLRQFGAEPVRKVIADETARDMKKALVAVVEKGTGRQAYIEGYSIGGKTGTAQKVIGGRVSQEKHMASFVGFAPADDPQVLVLVILDEPQGAYFGGQVAAPLFKAIMADTLQYMDVPRTPAGRVRGAPGVQGEATPPGQESPLSAAEAGLVEVPNTVGLTVGEARKALSDAGLKPRVEGQGEKVVQQVPPRGVKVSRDTTVILFSEDDQTRVIVPYLKGSTVREAGGTLSKLGLILVPSGTGFAVSQDPEPGTRVKKGTEVKVRFEPAPE